MDPTWSPDGSWLAFTLFGSIWRVPAGGGTAEQLTSSAGYHGHPAWSPDGTKIAYVRGDAPAGPCPISPANWSSSIVTGGTERELIDSPAGRRNADMVSRRNPHRVRAAASDRQPAARNLRGRWKGDADSVSAAALSRRGPWVDVGLESESQRDLFRRPASGRAPDLVHAVQQSSDHDPDAVHPLSAGGHRSSSRSWPPFRAARK